MRYCPKCGSDIDDTMAFCPKCGTPLKGSTPSQAAPQNEVPEKQETPKKAANVEIQQKNQYSFLNYLIAGVVLMIVGIFSILFLTSRFVASGQDVAIMLIIIGAIIIIGVIYVTTPIEKYLRRLSGHPKKNP